LQRDLRAPVGETAQAVLDHLRAIHGDGDDLFLRLAEDILPLRRRGAVVHVDDHLLRAHQGLDGLLDQILPRLHKTLNGNIIGDALFFDEAAIEGELGVGGRGETDLDLLEATFHQRIKHLQFLTDVHRHSQGLIAIAEIDAAPQGCFGERLGRPLTLGQRNGIEALVFGRRIFQHNKTEIERT
jgi:hypothetical protein